MNRLFMPRLRPAQPGVSGSPGNLRYWQPFMQLPGLVTLQGVLNGALVDLSPNAHTLTKSGNPGFGLTGGGGGYIDKIAADYYNANDAAWNSITGELFVAGWVQHDAGAVAQETYIAKWTATGNQRAWALFRSAAGLLTFQMTADGSTVKLITSSPATYTTAWTFVAGRFVPSTSVACWINTTKYNNATAIPATSIDGTGAIELGSWNSGTTGMVGNQGVFGLYNVAPSDEQVTALYNATSRFYTNP